MTSLLITATTPSPLQHKKESGSCTDCNSRTPNTQQSPSEPIPKCPLELRTQLFQESSFEAGEITQKISQKAVSWLITVCWSKNLSEECLWSSVLLFYGLKAQKKMKKETLELTLLASLHLSIKMCSTKVIALQELTAATGKAISVQSLIEVQAMILETFNYNIVIPHYLSEVFYAGLSQDQIYVLLFFCELLMLKNCDIFFDNQKIEAMILLVDPVQRKIVPDRKVIYTQIKEAYEMKEAKIIVRKYEPKFDIQRLMDTLTE